MLARSLTPALRTAVCTALASPGHVLVRCAGGYRAANASAPTITKRAVAMLDRAYLIRFVGDMNEAAVLTDKGERIASELAQAAGIKCKHRGCDITDGKPCAFADCPNRTEESRGL